MNVLSATQASAQAMDMLDSLTTADQVVAGAPAVPPRYSTCPDIGADGRATALAA